MRWVSTSAAAGFQAVAVAPASSINPRRVTRVSRHQFEARKAVGLWLKLKVRVHTPSARPADQSVAKRAGLPKNDHGTSCSFSTTSTSACSGGRRWRRWLRRNESLKSGRAGSGSAAVLIQQHADQSHLSGLLCRYWKQDAQPLHDSLSERHRGWHRACLGGKGESPKDGISSASLVLRGGATVDPIVAVNSWGAVVRPDCGRLWAADLALAGEIDRQPPIPDAGLDRKDFSQCATAISGANTTTAVIATDAALDKGGCWRFVLPTLEDNVAAGITPIEG